MKTYYKTQYGTFFNIIFIILIPFLIYASYYQIGNKPIPMIVAIILSILFLGILLFFYKLTIQIDNKKIEAKFGIGVLTKSMKLQDIDLNSIKTIKMPWYYGLGIRLTPKGWLWNVKFGEAILIQNKNKTKTFLIGTDDADEIIKILKTTT